MVKMDLTPMYPVFRGEHKGHKFIIEFGTKKYECKITGENRHQIFYGWGHNQSNARFGIPIIYKRAEKPWPLDKKIGGFTQTQKEMVEDAYMRITTEINFKEEIKKKHKEAFTNLAVDVAPLKIIIEEPGK